jgi:hypothetical protein
MRAVALLVVLGAVAPTPKDLLQRAVRAEAAGKDEDAARDATRIVVEAPGSGHAPEAAGLVGRVRLRQGHAGDAAWWLERAVSTGVRELAPLRALAVRSLLRKQGLGGTWGPFQDVATVEVRRPVGLLRTPSGIRAVLDGRAGVLVWALAGGRTAPPSSLGEVQAGAVRGDGKLVLASGAQVVLVDPTHPEAAMPFAGLGRYAPASALAVDAAGTVWVARGSRVGRLDQGASEPAGVVDAKGMRVEGLAPLPPGRGIALLDTRANALMTLRPDGTLQPLSALPWGERGRPSAIAADAAGQIVVLDGKSGEILLLDAQGGVADRVPAPASGRDVPVALALDGDGALEIVTEDGRLRRSP